MKIEKNAIAGTLESSDVLVKIEPHDDLEIIVNSDVMPQFGKQIRIVVERTLSRLNVTQGLIIIDDKGALDFIIEARVQAAVFRSVANPELNWSQIL